MLRFLFTKKILYLCVLNVILFVCTSCSWETEICLPEQKTAFDTVLARSERFRWEALLPQRFFSSVTSSSSQQTPLLFGSVWESEQTLTKLLPTTEHQLLVRGLAMQGLAVAMTERDRLSRHHLELQQLVREVSNASCEGATRVTLLAMHEQLAQIQLLLATMVQMQAATLLPKEK